MKYQITFANQFKPLAFLIYGTLFFAVFLWFFYDKIGFGLNIYAIQYFIIYYLVLLVCTLFLHFEYYLINRKDVVIINKTEETITINAQTLIPFKEISKIIIVLSPVLYRKGTIRFFPTDDYHYAVIKTKGGENFIFTCLMNNKVEEVMENIIGVDIEKHRRFFPTTLYHP